MSRLHDRVGAAGLLLVSGLAWVHSARFPVEARMFPRLILVFLAGLATVMLGRTFWSPVGSSRDKPFCANTRRFLMAVAGILIYILVVSSIGYFSATVLFIPCAALLLGYRRPVPIAIATLGFCIFIYFVFVYLFERPLPSEIVLTRFP